MPFPNDVKPQSEETEAAARAYEEVLELEYNDRLKVAINRKPSDFHEFRKLSAKLDRLLKTRRVPKPFIADVEEGVVEQQPSGLYDAALQTKTGRVVLRNAVRSDLTCSDVQLVASTATSVDSTIDDDATPDSLIDRFASSLGNVPAKLVFEMELTRFDEAQHERLLPLLWRYIESNRASSDVSTLHTVGSAIRKYIAIVPMDEIDRLAPLLEPGHNAPLSIQLEIEVAKMLVRNFEVFPPDAPNLHPALSSALWDMAQAYANPRLLLRDKHSAAASLCIQAIVAMRSEFAADAVDAAVQSHYRWFAEIVMDGLDRLLDHWRGRNPDAAAWLANLRDTQIQHVGA